jgi:hypothetical protein
MSLSKRKIPMWQAEFGAVLIVSQVGWVGPWAFCSVLLRGRGGPRFVLEGGGLVMDVGGAAKINGRV